MIQKKKNIMDSILAGQHTEFEERVEQLNCLIYKNDPDSMDEPIPELTDGNDEKVWQSSRDDVSVQVWESRAKIRVKVSPGKYKNVSMKRIADIAVEAILEELKKED